MKTIENCCVSKVVNFLKMFLRSFVFVILFMTCVYGSLVVKVKDWDGDPFEETIGIPFATVPVGKTLRADKISFCFRFQINGGFGKHFGFSSYTNVLNFGTWFRFTANYGFIIANSRGLIFKIPKAVLRPYSWYHFCASINGTHYKVVADGNLWFENKLKDEIIQDIFLQQLVVLGSGLNGTKIFNHFISMKLWHNSFQM